MSFWDANRDARLDGEVTHIAEVQMDTRRANEVLSKIERKVEIESIAWLELAELLSEARREDYPRQVRNMSFDQFVEQANLGIGKRQAYYLMNIWDAADKLTIPREQLEAAKKAKLKLIFTLDAEKFSPEIQGLVKEAPELTVEEVAERVKALKSPDEDEFTWLNVKVKREDRDQEILPAMELAKQTVGEEMGDGEAITHICEAFRQDPNNQAAGAVPISEYSEAPEDAIGEQA